MIKQLFNNIKKVWFEQGFHKDLGHPEDSNFQNGYSFKSVEFHSSAPTSQT
jgi:hypothetical protein